MSKPFSDPKALNAASAPAGRRAAAIKWGAVGLVIVGALVAARQLPVAAALDALEARIGELGVWGPVVFGMVYVLAVVLLAPCAALSLAAGALFGPVVGTLVVSLSSTTGAALTFLIGRYGARETVARTLRQYPKFDAVDQAISDGGWKVVAMLRLSPVVPFNVQNYLYGLTRIRFWPCVLTSWIAMLPGTMMYVYLGYAGRAGVEAAAQGERTRTPAEWALIVVGLLATGGVMVYVSRLARKAMAQATAPTIMRPANVVEGVVAADTRRHIDVGLDDVEQVVTRSQALTALERLAIYGYAYRARLVECLREEYSVLRHEPKAQHVSLPGGTIKNEDDLKSWLASAENKIREKLREGPVIV
ncbi:MAG TPA: VTT domain-containing protein [Pirellulales bacterium]|nr:VTT domain-containing protein [Pirellulales bacterium]